MGVTRAIGRPAGGPRAPDAAELRAGRLLGRYELLVRIATGGMAHVWLAQQSGPLGFTKLVAIKIIRTELAVDPVFRAMFLDEAQLAARIRHANVVEVLDLGEDGGHVYQTMTLVEGAALSTIIVRAQAKRGGRGLPVGASLRIVIDVLRGLHAAHELRDEHGALLGVVHRDVSPQNVLVGVDGIAKLSDFGIARAFGHAPRGTFSGDVKGKVRYLAPEQIDGDAPTRRSDVFSAGVVLWETLAGKSLFSVPTSEDGLVARRGAPIPDLRDVMRSVPPRVADVAMKALARDPTARYASALEMADALEAAAKSSSAAFSHQEVAEVVTEVVGPDLEARSALLRAARAGLPVANHEAPLEPSLPKTLAGSTAEVGQALAPPPARRGRRMLAFAVVGAALLAGFGVASLRTVASGPGPGADSKSSAPPEPAAGPSPEPVAPALEARASAEGTLAPTASPPAPKLRSTAPRTQRSKVQSTATLAPQPAALASASSSARRPTFADPYAGSGE
jgi:serine/threonine-protein kinase